MLRLLPLLLLLAGCAENEHCRQVRRWYLEDVRHEAWELAEADARILDALGCKPMPELTGDGSVER